MCTCSIAIIPMKRLKIIMQKRKLGHQGLKVSALGLGTMMMQNNEESVPTIHGALDLGVTLLDTADIYGEDYALQQFGGNEKLVGRALKGRRDEAVIATKFGITHSQGPKGDSAYIKKSVDASLFHLGIDYIDLYYQHRVDPNTPIEETVGTMAELVKQGKIVLLVYRKQRPNRFVAPIQFILLRQWKPNTHCGVEK
jgi:aryl-alcohol dehydrogenase-like predicted oxidoreductase